MFHHRPRRALWTATPALALLVLAWGALPAFAEEEDEAQTPIVVPDAPPALVLTPAEDAELRRGEVVLRTVRVSDDERWAEGIFLFDATPPELWHLVTHPPTQQEMFDELEVYEEVERYDDGLQTHGIADASWILPEFEYWLRTHNDGTRQWNAWQQIRGDFDRNEGYWRFVWDPAQQKTYGALTLKLAFRGILSIVPESWIIGLQRSNMPKVFEIVQERVNAVRLDDPSLAQARQTEWDLLMSAGRADRTIRIARAEAEGE